MREAKGWREKMGFEVVKGGLLLDCEHDILRFLVANDCTIANCSLGQWLEKVKPAKPWQPNFENTGFWNPG